MLDRPIGQRVHNRRRDVAGTWRPGSGPEAVAEPATGHGPAVKTMTTAYAMRRLASFLLLA